MIWSVEYQRIIKYCKGKYQQWVRPYSIIEANNIKQMLGGDLVIICYPEARAYDFALTTVKYFMIFTVDNFLFQLCILK